jgi:hypothetical protein
MPILDNTQTVEQYVQQHRNRVKMFFRQLETGFGNLGDGFWRHPTFTPQQICAAYGTDALELFIMSSKMQTFLESLTGGPFPVAPSGWIIAPQGNGTVILTPPPEVTDPFGGGENPSEDPSGENPSEDPSGENPSEDPSSDPSSDPSEG